MSFKQSLKRIPPMNQQTVSRIRRAPHQLAAPMLALVVLGATACSDTTQPTLPRESGAAPVFAQGGNGGGGKQQPSILFTSDRDGKLELYTMNPDGSNVMRLTNNPAGDAGGVWSPDNKRIAFVSSRDNPQGDIYVMNANGTGVARVTFGPGGSQSPSWSKDGNQLAFVSTRDAANPASPSLSDFEIYTINVDGTGLNRLTHNSDFESDPAWSPDGKHIAYASGQDHPGTDRAELYVMQADGSGVTRLTFMGAVVQRPSWDAHGRVIAFSTAFGSENGLWLIQSDGAGTTRLTFGASGVDNWPSWSPDGISLAFVSNRDGNSEIYSMNADGTGQTRLTFAPGLDWFPQWSR
jgi:TolB protein